MAITPRTIFSSAGPATVAAVSLLAFTAVGTVAYMSVKDGCPASERQAVPALPQQHQSAGSMAVCNDLRSALGANRAVWSEADWMRYTTCLDRHGRSDAAIDAAERGLERYPNSSALYNVKAYHQIVKDRHTRAVETLRTALGKTGTSYDGILENNLAWAGLWARREMPLDRARSLYQKALDRSSGMCAYLHTGLWVEYAIAESEQGVERFRALKNFRNLRQRYEPCLSRLEQGDWQTVAEVAGAGVMFDSLASEDGRTSKSSSSGSTVLRRVVRTLESDFPTKSIEALCRDATPLESAHHECTKRLRSVAKSATVRRPSDSSAQSASKNSDATAGAGGGCPAMMK